MPYIPTQEELSEFSLIAPYAGLSATLDVAFTIADGMTYVDTTISFEPQFKTWGIDGREGFAQFYPQSADDVATLIRLLTPPKE